MTGAVTKADSNVPLGFVSLTENLMMIAMALWMMAKSAIKVWEAANQRTTMSTLDA